MSEETKKLLKEIKECDSLHNNCDYLLEHSDCDLLIEYVEYLEKKDTQLKSVLKEIREYINKQLASCDNESNLSYEICNLTISKYKKLLEIIDKALKGGDE